MQISLAMLNVMDTTLKNFSYSPQLVHEEPAMSMQIILAKHSEIQQANLNTVEKQEVKDGERLSIAVKDMGACEIYPQTIHHNPNGRLVRYLLYYL